MAVMGVRINDGGSGPDTSVANVFAKALFGDPDREMKFARLQSDLATDEYQRRQIQANEDYIRSQQALKDQELQYNEAGVAPMTKLARDYITTTQQPGPAPTEAPVPVELGPDPTAPIPADRPAVAEAPVPVELGPDPYAPIPADRPAPPPIELPPSANPTASTLSDLMAPDMPVPVLQTSDGSDPTTLGDLLSPQPMTPRPASVEMGAANQFRAMPSDAVAPATLGTMNVTPGQEEEGPGDLPVPVDEPEFVDPNAGRAVRPAVPTPEPFVDPNEGRPHPAVTKVVAEEVQKAVGPVALSEEEWSGLAKMAIETGDPAGTLNKLLGTAGLTYGDPSNGDKLRQSMALMTGSQPTTTSVAGAADTSGVEAATAGRITEAAADPSKLKDRISSTGGVDVQITEDAAGNVVEKPIAGATPKPAVIQIVEKVPYQVTTDEKGNAHLKLADGFTAPDAPPFDTTSLDGQLLNKIVLYNRKKRNGLATTPDEDLDYAAAFKEKFTPKMTTVRLPDGRQDTQTQFFDPPADFLVPPGFNTGPATAAAPAETAPAVAADAANPPAVTGGGPATVVNARGETVPVKNYGGWTEPGQKPPTKTDVVEGPAGKVVHTISGDQKDREVTGEALTAYTTGREAIDAARLLNKYGPGGRQLPSGVQNLLEDWQSTGLSRDMLEGIVDQETREYARAVLTFINAPKRTESGAAVNAQEIKDYVKRYTMHGDNLAEYKSARNARTQHMKAVRSGLTAMVKPSMLQEYDTDLAKAGLDLDENLSTDAKEKTVRRRPNEKGDLEVVK